MSTLPTGIRKGKNRMTTSEAAIADAIQRAVAAIIQAAEQETESTMAAATLTIIASALLMIVREIRSPSPSP
jgi:hypothetical protein